MCWRPSRGRSGAGVVPKKWANVRAIHLKAAESVALPVYQAVPAIGLRIEGVKRDEEENVGEVNEVKKIENKKKKRKVGRIHEVNLDEMLLAAKGSDGIGGEGSEDDGLVDKKRKKKDEEKKKKAATGIVKKSKRNSLASEELGGRGVEEEEEENFDGLVEKKKSEVGKMASGGLKLKSKKSKRV
ncbi:hypothetical protein Sjap_008653 [Stephania japonica]|uniref:Uncharacterized protein n=1 Tax=Stephania japonica TaxID=461633 RepID=A0AAP0JQE5_9MAGN